MSQETRMKPLSIAIGAAFVTSLAATPAANATANPFAMSELPGGYRIAEMAEGKCGSGKVMDESKSSSGMMMEEGKCGGNKAKAATKEGTDKAKAEGKCGEGKCGSSKVMDESKSSSGMKMEEGKCGANK